MFLILILILILIWPEADIRQSAGLTQWFLAAVNG